MGLEGDGKLPDSCLSGLFRAPLDRPGSISYKPRALPEAGRLARRRSAAQVAQLVEHATENRSVGGSIPPLGTISPSIVVR